MKSATKCGTNESIIPIEIHKVASITSTALRIANIECNAIDDDDDEPTAVIMKNRSLGTDSSPGKKIFSLNYDGDRIMNSSTV